MCLMLLLDASNNEDDDDDDESEQKKVLRVRQPATFIKLMKISVCYKKEHDEHIFVLMQVELFAAGNDALYAHSHKMKANFFFIFLNSSPNFL